MIVHTQRIPYKYGETITIKPLFDAHIGVSNHDKPALKKYLGEPEENTYILGGGDTFDSVMIKDPRYSKSNDPTKGQDVIDEQVEYGYDILNRLPIRENSLVLALVITKQQ